MCKDWIVQLKGEFPTPDDEEAEYELSVVRTDNDHGRQSFGWGDTSKIVLFDNQGNVAEPEEKDFAMVVANKLCEALNSETRNGEKVTHGS